jgi:uncharacterized NAD-dependent epimerase/dehydratase family protein
MVILTEGKTTPFYAKTAMSLVKYRSQDVLGLLDGTQAGQTAGELLGIGGEIPVVASLDDVDSPDSLVLGIAPPGGKVPTEWREIIVEAIGRGLDIVSGLHEFLSNDAELSELATKHGVRIVDVRKNNEDTLSDCVEFRPGCLRIHTVGHDCTVGKMVASLEVQLGLVERGIDAHFVATGQTGIMVSGEGTPIDCVVSDFVNGAAERLVLQSQHHDVLLIEGQGSVVHPRFSGVTLGLLHGCAPQGLILCYEVGRETVKGLDHVPIEPLGKLRDFYETIASVRYPCKVIGVAMNSRHVDEDAAERERVRVEAELGVPVCDVYRHGSGPLVEAVLALREELSS